MYWKYTHTEHAARIYLGLNMNEYAVLDIFYQSQTHPRFTRDGWAENSYQKIATFLNIGKGTVFSIVEKAVESGLMEVNPANPRHKKTTEKFYDIAYLNYDQIQDFIEKNVQKVNGERSETERDVQKPNANRSENEHKELNKSGSLKTKVEDKPTYLFDTIPPDQLQLGEKNEKEKNSAKKEKQEIAVGIILFLNEHSGRKLPHDVNGRGKKNVEDVMGLLNKGYKREEIEDMILMKCWEWRDTNMAKNLKPITLFKRHGERYIEESEEAKENVEFQKMLKLAKDKTSNGSVDTGALTKEAMEILSNF